MIQKIANFIRRLQIGRFLILTVIGLILLVAGFITRGFVPVSWLQSLHVGSIGLPAWLVQAPAASPTSRADAVAVPLSNNNEVTTLALPTPTVTSETKPLELGPGVVTVLTVTPTPFKEVSEYKPTAAIPIVSTATSAPTLVSFSDSATPIAPAKTRERSPIIQNDLRSLNLLIGVSRIQLLVFGETQQPTAEERAAFDANLQLVIFRMQELEDQLSTDETAAGLFSAGGTAASGQAAELIAVTREAVSLLRSEIAAYEANSADLIMAEAQFGMVQVVIQHLQLMADPTWDDLIVEQVLTPALTSTPTPLPTSPNQASVEFDQMLAMMDGMLNQMQAILAAGD